ncbi:hypothetical protein [Chryseobacterium sp. CFBP8996]|uniref:hypothetical protein n=1 Tax=Chryseobacterium sp. CFBP8996 TaxID=3096529 RepID=UPI002A69CA1D|nr:hypothetical protein [Chryseobacterium sp. CFBP8996]MDY0931116.1 hypothetical protein [Chryseobacterium sp. CFBP8996]
MKQKEQQGVIDEIIKDLTAEIRIKEKKVLPKIGKCLNQKQPYTTQQFNGLFGGKNNTFLDVVRTRFSDFEDFYAQWLKGLIDKYEHYRGNDKHWDSKLGEAPSAVRIYKLLLHEDIRHLVEIFLERNFYKQLNERTRNKPNDNLWAIWFGYKLTYGLLIAPKFHSNNWHNDKSEIRRVKYSYWSIGHVFSEGLVDPMNNKIYKVNTLTDFINFYQGILKRLSVSIYEQNFYDLYVEYLQSSKNVEDEPLLIPEFRYAGITPKHIHRLDFTIFNSHTSQFTGFELSPASTHMKVENLKLKQNKVNAELSDKWGKEMTKRNDYFKTFDITTVTFTDIDLVDIVKCFELVKEKLQARTTKINLKSQLERLKN